LQSQPKIPLEFWCRVKSANLRNPGSDAFRPEFGAEPFPGYKLLWLRGRGGFATVWEATSPSGERIALKFMSSQNMASTARELRSMQAISQIRHPALLRTRQIWSLPGYIVIGMDLAEGSLQDLMNLYTEEFEQRIEFEKLGLYLMQVASGLDFLNARRHQIDGRTVGYQHGDIKPNNILLLNDRAVLADYGMATPTNGPSTPCPRAGTLDYAAPELFAGYVTDSSDQFSLAVTYTLLRGGALPFPKIPDLDAIKRNFQRPAADLCMLPAEERSIVGRALSPIPINRYPNCTEFVSAVLATQNYRAVHNRDLDAWEMESLLPKVFDTPRNAGTLRGDSGVFAGVRRGS
jgi:serine/threonine protein kinase